MKDKVIQHFIKQEELRQQAHIELIASENYVSKDVMEAQGSCLTNKYAEGYPGKRYYGGCEFVDEVEQIAIDRAKALFECSFANVQPHSGSQANTAVYAALLQPGDKVMGMDLSQGGHLTHGSSVNFSGKLYDFVSYGVDEDGFIDYDVVAEIAEEQKPKLIIAGYSAYSREINFKRFREIADSVGAYLMVDMAHFAGFIAAGLMDSPIPHAHVVTSTTHKTLRGPRGGLILSNENDEDLYKKLNSSIFPGNQGGPLMHVIAAKAVAFGEALTHEYRMYMFNVRANARMSAEILKENGLTIVSGGTDNHMFLIDLSDEDFTGKDVEKWLGQAGITVNKNTVPGETRSPFQTSGIRIGLAAITTRGFSEFEIGEVMNGIAEIIKHAGDSEVIEHVKDKMLPIALTKSVYPVI